MMQDLEDGVPVVQQLHRPSVSLGMVVALASFAGGAQVSQQRGICRRQVGGRAFGRPVRDTLNALMAAVYAARAGSPADLPTA